MLDEFETWFKANDLRLRDKGIHVEIKRREDPTGAINVVLDSDSWVAGITCWGSGAFDVDVLSYDSGECLLAKRYDFRTSEEMLSVLEDVCNRMVDRLFVMP